VQPGATVGKKTYCPVSGVVFTISDASPRDDVEGRSIYLCCGSCAKYFAENRARLIVARQLGA
jgi:hypothetical protein